jgi:hypothetical protein
MAVSQTDWDNIAHVALVICKIAGVFGAYLGLSERLHSRERASGWRRVAPAVMILLAVSAEVIDAELKHREDTKAEIRNEQLLRPIHAVTARLELKIPSNELEQRVPAYYQRVKKVMNSDVVRDTGYLEFTEGDDAYPGKDDRPVLEALKAYYSSSLRFYPKEEMPGSFLMRPSKVKKDLKSADVWIELAPKTDYVYYWGETDAVSVPAFPPEGRRYMLNREGLAFMDEPVTVNLNDIASSRKLRSISDFQGGNMTLTVCPEGPEVANSDLSEDITETSRMIYLRNLSLQFDGVGTFGGKAIAAQFTRTAQFSCVLYSFSFPDDATAMSKIFK